MTGDALKSEPIVGLDPSATTSAKHDRCQRGAVDHFRGWAGGCPPGSDVPPPPERPSDGQHDPESRTPVELVRTT